MLFLVQCWSKFIMGRKTLRTRPSVSTSAWHPWPTEHYQFKWGRNVSPQQEFVDSLIATDWVTFRSGLVISSAFVHLYICLKVLSQLCIRILCSDIDWFRLNVQSGQRKFQFVGVSVATRQRSYAEKLKHPKLVGVLCRSLLAPSANGGSIDVII